MLVGAICAMPRWRFARSLESRTCDEGVSRAVKAKNSYFFHARRLFLGWANSKNFYQPWLHIESALLLGGSGHGNVHTPFLSGEMLSLRYTGIIIPLFPRGDIFLSMNSFLNPPRRPHGVEIITAPFFGVLRSGAFACSSASWSCVASAF